MDATGLGTSSSAAARRTQAQCLRHSRAQRTLRFPQHSIYSSATLRRLPALASSTAAAERHRGRLWPAHWHLVRQSGAAMTSEVVERNLEWKEEEEEEEEEEGFDRRGVMAVRCP